MKKVMHLFLNGKIGLVDLPYEIDEAVDRWHNSDSTEPLHKYLGMTIEEYGLMFEDPQFFMRVMEFRTGVGEPLTPEQIAYGQEVAKRISEQFSKKS